jgi:DMSO/TMAO reductase YedYZ molybdopterin-dependent catalytic subunit
MMDESNFLTRRKIKIAQDAQLSGGKKPSESIDGSGPLNRHGVPQLPPGQTAVTKWPVLDLGIQPDVPHANWTLTISGEVSAPAQIDWDQFMALPQVNDVSDFHCVTTWSRMDNSWEGVRFSTLAHLAQVHSSATHVFISGYDGYTTNLQLDEAMDNDVLIVHTWDGKPLTREHGGPVRMIVPKKYAWKGSKWIKEIEFLTSDRKGFWEERGYSNTAEPWYNDRYDVGEQKLP